MNLFRSCESCSQANQNVSTIPCPDNLKSRCFSLKVLSCMYELYCANSCFQSGIRSKDIIKHMSAQYDLDGDVKTQVEKHNKVVDLT